MGCEVDFMGISWIFVEDSLIDIRDIPRSDQIIFHSVGFPRDSVQLVNMLQFHVWVYCVCFTIVTDDEIWSYKSTNITNLGAHCFPINNVVFALITNRDVIPLPCNQPHGGAKKLQSCDDPLILHGDLQGFPIRVWSYQKVGVCITLW